jgi:hypothetical protein
MSFNSKIALAVVATALLTPLAASANDVTTGSTAAAVSIKFNKCSGSCGGTNGNFSITPGGTATGGGYGVSELSAAVATGETSAEAKSASGKFGTSATASGYSAPVNFYYEVSKSNESYKLGADLQSNEKYTKEAALEFAANSKSSEYDYLSKSASGYSEFSKSKKGISSKYGFEADKTVKSGESNESSKTLSASYDSTASKNTSAVIAVENTSNAARTGYSYHGPSTGMKFLPGIVKY